MSVKRSTIVLLTLALPGIALAQSTTPKTFGDLANMIVQLFNSATVDLIVLAIVVFFWGIASAMFKEGAESSERIRQQLLWGVIVIFLAVSVWGIVVVLQNSIFGNGSVGSSSGGGTAQTCSNFGNCNFQ